MTQAPVPLDLLASRVARDADTPARQTAGVTRRVIADALCMVALITLSAASPLLDRAAHDLTSLLGSASAPVHLPSEASSAPEAIITLSVDVGAPVANGPQREVTNRL
jgi:hypothetical protein